MFIKGKWNEIEEVLKQTNKQRNKIIITTTTTTETLEAKPLGAGRGGREAGKGSHLGWQHPRTLPIKKNATLCPPSDSQC